ncbi:hypothetical protein GCM10009639_39640 [Kitasatospora putterlickiae]|uniref:Uncharacterized protein n=1 Tax=Kitasatospora putterlickiae TaxID=221725 RepID=A0ABN1Y6Y1_9ACTN
MDGEGWRGQRQQALQISAWSMYRRTVNAGVTGTGKDREADTAAARRCSTFTVRPSPLWSRCAGTSLCRAAALVPDALGARHVRGTPATGRAAFVPRAFHAGPVKATCLTPIVRHVNTGMRR